MAHIFNIYFTFQHVSYNAMVTVHHSDEYVSYTLKNLDESLLDLLPGTQIICRSSGEMYFENSATHPVDELTQAILHALADHIDPVNA